MKTKLILVLCLTITLCGCSEKAPIQTPAQKVQAEIVAVYQLPNGAWETCLKHEDGSRSLWPNHKLGAPGDKFSVWKRGANEWLQDPN